MAGISTWSPRDLPKTRVLLQDLYRRRFVCEGCIVDGQIIHTAPHIVWVQDVVVPLPGGNVLYWKDATCEEMGLPCCQYQSLCSEVIVDKLWETAGTYPKDRDAAPEPVTS
jgi:hypothetical protein